MSPESNETYLPAILLGVYLACATVLLTLRLNPAVIGFKNALFYLLFPSVHSAQKVLTHGYVVSKNLTELLKVQQENQVLAARNNELLRWQQEYQSLADENDRLRSMLLLRERPQFTVLGTRIISRDAGGWYHSCVIDRGSADGVRVDNPVIAVQGTVSGLVGRVLETSLQASTVLLITDGVSSVAVTALRTRDDGVLQGQGTAQLALRYIVPEATLAEGDAVQTAGTGGVFPSGLLVGTVLSVTPPSLGDFRTATIKPAINFNTLRELAVLTTPLVQERQP